jgi:hypothetical protein
MINVLILGIDELKLDRNYFNIEKVETLGKAKKVLESFSIDAAIVRCLPEYSDFFKRFPKEKSILLIAESSCDYDPKDNTFFKVIFELNTDYIADMIKDIHKKKSDELPFSIIYNMNATLSEVAAENQFIKNTLSDVHAKLSEYEKNQQDLENKVNKINTSKQQMDQFIINQLADVVNKLES